MRLKFGFQLILLFFIANFTSAQEWKNENAIYSNDIATVLLSKNISIYDPLPVIRINSGETLKLMFDQLKAQNEYFNYTYIHCDAHWNPSDMQQSEYLVGNTMAEITDFSFSTNTYQQYVHYSLVFPNENLSFTRSGNYILRVFRNFDESQPVLSRRFMVLDEQTSLEVKINSATDVRYRYQKQEVDVEVDYTNYTIPNPFHDVNLTLMQNNSWETAIMGLKPLFVNNNKLSFNYEDRNLFDGGNEFRFFDIRSLRFFSNRVANKYTDSLVNVVLEPDETRSHLSYLFWIDYNGKRVIENKDGANIMEDGDYALVHFYLKTKDKRDLGDIYVYGELSDWRFNDQFKMEYDSEKEMYYTKAKLKQSYYNYLYALKDKSGKLDYSFTEGNHFETENDYTVLVYHKNVFYGYDELIGIITKNSANDTGR